MRVNLGLEPRALLRKAQEYLFDFANRRVRRYSGTLPLRPSAARQYYKVADPLSGERLVLLSCQVQCDWHFHPITVPVGINRQLYIDLRCYLWPEDPSTGQPVIPFGGSDWDFDSSAFLNQTDYEFGVIVGNSVIPQNATGRYDLEWNKDIIDSEGGPFVGRENDALWVDYRLTDGWAVVSNTTCPEVALSLAWTTFRRPG